ncbi:response regulator transcription factor [Oscillochloris sp. ZM17-4]|uniref:response regulator transcription factor n=1 Tax=Oscillochloris sp. ZM17-4 TaxID=2866714 RepID=UPI001C73B188|nr:response regulator transcription factor [Oscillochloris sp. ZM17-4]MBX0328554.1 response regulator transcription factor [Oscillochloris sp. ZM17-4]
MAGERILVVDDEPSISEVVALYLRREGFEVEIAADGDVALEMISRRRPDLLVLDLMLPGVDGLAITRQVRSGASLPIIMLTARGEEIDRVLGLELGADDYVTKPFSPRELVARVKAVLRRSQPPADALRDPATAPIVAGALRIDPAARSVALDGVALSLTAREFDLLTFMARRPGHVFTREQLLDQVWGYTFASDMSTVTVHIRRLREKIEDDPTTPRRLLTVWGVGYKFEAGYSTERNS